MNSTDLGSVKNFTSAGAIAKRRFVAFAASEDKVEQAASAAKAVIGVTGIVGTVAGDERIDVYMSGNREVEAGGAFAQGDYICADAQGRAVLCAPGAGVTAHAAGVALAASGAAGQIVPFTINRAIIKG